MVVEHRHEMDILDADFHFQIGLGGLSQQDPSHRDPDHMEIRHGFLEHSCCEQSHHCLARSGRGFDQDRTHVADSVPELIDILSLEHIGDLGDDPSLVFPGFHSHRRQQCVEFVERRCRDNCRGHYSSCLIE